jgi:hypothetical protein
MSGAITLAIPASDEVQILPSVLNAGGVALDLSGLLLTTNWRAPIGSVLSFPTDVAMANWFGAASQEAALGEVYFAGFDNSTKKPGAMLVAQYNQANVGAWLLGGSVQAEGMTLAQLQGLSGTLTVTLDGTPITSSPINLSSATSFSAAAELISLGVGIVGATACQFTGAIAGATLTVSSVSSGSIAVGQEIRGNGASAGTVVSAFGPGTTGGAGTYTVTNTQTVGSGSMTSVIPTVSYDSVTGAFMVQSATRGVNSGISYASGALAASLNLTAATGATISQGAAAATPAAFMAAVTQQTQNWASFTTAFDPDGGSGNMNKQAFAAWCNSTNDRYGYIGWDTDITPTESNNATASLGGIVKTANSNGTMPIYSPTQGPTIACFEMGAWASVDFSQTEGRKTMKFRAQSGLTPDVTNQTIAVNLRANGYNFYGAWATANEMFTYFSPGQISGQFQWADSYINQIWLNNQFQLALMVLLTRVGHIPYNSIGYGLIRSALKSAINAAVNFGAIVAGVTLSSLQVAEVNQAAGLAIDATLTNQGWYLQILDPTTQIRQARGTPVCNFWYMDGESVQSISLASILLQ